MKNPALVIIGLLIFLIPEACQKQKSEWQGKILNENGVKVVQNPDEPLYGELILDLEEDLIIGSEEDDNYMFYRVGNIEVDDQENFFVLDSGNHRIQKYDKEGNHLQTIGKKGQGPGEFERPYQMFFDFQNNIYVSEGRKIQKFNYEGQFIKTIKLPYFLYDFAVNSEGNIMAAAFVSSGKGQNFGVIFFDSEGKKLKTIAEFPGMSVVARKSASFIFSHAYSPSLSFSHLIKDGVVYGYSPEYKLFLINETGDNFLIIKKDEPFHSISRKEKNKIINDVIESTGREGQKWPKDVVEEGANFLNHRPFFNHIMSDDRGRIYVRKVKPVLDKSQHAEFDVFSKDGYYLYKTSLLFTPNIIRNGYLYDVFSSEETGDVRIKRLKVDNWNEIKEGI